MGQEWMHSLTSGTTEMARVVGHSTKCLDDLCEGDGWAPLQSDSRVALTLPLSFHYGFSVVTSTFVSNATLLLPSTLPTDATFVFRLVNGFKHAVRPFWQRYHKVGRCFLVS